VQTYTEQTPIDAYRDDALHRASMCEALGRKKPELVPVSDAATAVVTAVDGKIVGLRQAMDALVRSKALETAEKLDMIEAYEMTRKILSAYEGNRLMTYMPEPPSRLTRSGNTTLNEWVSTSITSLKTLPEDSPVRRDFLPTLEREFAEYKDADQAEDTVRLTLSGVKLALNTYKAELSQAREEQLALILAVYKDRSKLELFTLPWR
jgi:hypothetical protein